MTTGIYQLTFDSDKFYVGKSVNMEERFIQHIDKMRKGMAAKPMQREYDQCGPPEQSFLYTCHEDHIDFLEPIFINQLRDGGMLNTAFTDTSHITSRDIERVNSSGDLLEISTIGHLHIITELQEQLEAKDVSIEDLEDTIEVYKSEGLVIPADYVELEDTISTKVQELQRLKNLSLWDRIFNYKVYV